jgi:signal transduction histidine kinase
LTKKNPLRVFLFSLFVLSSLPSLSQENEIDSLASIINSCQPLDGDSCETVIQELIESVENSSNQRLYTYLLIHAGTAYSGIGDFEKAEQLLIEAKTISESIGAADLNANSIDLLGTTALMKGDYEQAISYFVSSAKIWEELGDKAELANVYLHASTVFFNTNELKKSQYYDRLVKDIAEELDDDQLCMQVMASSALNSMTYGINYYLQNEPDTAKLQTSLDTLDFYFKKSEVEYYEGLDFARKIGSQIDELSLLNNLVVLTLNMENNEKALEIAKKSEILSEVIGDVNQIIQSKVNIGSAYRRLGKLDLAVEYGEESLALAKKNGLERKEYVAKRTLYELYKQMDNFSNANILLEEISAYDLRTGNIERNKAIAEIDAQYQLVKKEKKIIELGITNTKTERQRNAITLGALLLSIFAFLTFIFVKARRERNDKIEFTEALISAQEEERKRISRDLHDGVGQSLLLMKKQMVSNHEVTIENQQMISDTLEEVRTISRDLHPFQLEKFGITASINNVIEKVERSTELFISKEIINIDEFILKRNQIHVFRAIQEGLNNIIKHAEATAARITIVEKGTELVMKIADNGKGYDHGSALIKSKSLGLRTMQERISSIGGRIKTDKNVPSGTILTFTIPKTS